MIAKGLYLLPVTTYATLFFVNRSTSRQHANHYFMLFQYSTLSCTDANHSSTLLHLGKCSTSSFKYRMGANHCHNCNALTSPSPTWFGCWLVSASALKFEIVAAVHMIWIVGLLEGAARALVPRGCSALFC